ncbi:MAG: hypothetical protein HQK49_08065 [Oligoflexia bacterium]|nr:hypothetical protein [Oligoflexia bacterium]
MKMKVVNILILSVAISTIFLISKKVCASNENNKITISMVKDGKIYVENTEDDNPKGTQNSSTTFGLMKLLSPSKWIFGDDSPAKHPLNGCEIVINESSSSSSSSIKKEYYVLDLVKNNFKNLKLEKMDLRGAKINDDNLQNNNFNNSIMDAKTRVRFLKLKFGGFKSSICRDSNKYIKFIEGLIFQTEDESEGPKEDKKIIDDFIKSTALKCIVDDTHLAMVINMPSVANNPSLLKLLAEEYFKTHSISQLNSLLGKIKNEDTHILFKREGLNKNVSSYEDYLLLMTPVNIKGPKQKKLQESYVEKLTDFVDETKYFILDESDSKKFENDWEKKYRNFSSDQDNVLALGRFYSCAVKKDGSVVCWGRADWGASTPPPDLKDVKSIAIRDFRSCALKKDGTVVCWGQDIWDQHVTPPNKLKNVKSITNGYSNSCALKKDGTVVFWGNTYGGKSHPPDGLRDVKSVGLGNQHSCAVKKDGTVVCWGLNYSGQSTPPDGLRDVKSIAVGHSNSCALKNDGTVVCWGEDGQKESTPPPDLRDVKSIASGSGHFCAIKKDGTVVCWGMNFYNESTPPEGLRDVKRIALGDHHSCALKKDGTVVCWGDDGHKESTPPDGLRVKID